MRDIFEDIFHGETTNPMEAARRAMRPPLRARFYKGVDLAEAADGFAVRLDGAPVRTPARHPLAAPSRPIADAIAAEWQDQRDSIDPATMPLTRLANAIIDRVAPAPQPVREEIERYLASDLVCYRAEGPPGLVARQAALWDPVLHFATETFGARFRVSVGVIHVAQSPEAVAAAAVAIPDGGQPWRLGALSVVTTLTGSALLALALAAGHLDRDAVWTAAHVDEDWNMETWGRDALALDRRAFRRTEFDAAATVLASLG